MTSIVLIGMPGAGKSTLGRRLASLTQRDFYDTDQLIEQHTGVSLQQSLDALGYLAMRELEGKVISDYPWPTARSMVIATGGSAVYSANAMTTLRALGLCVYLNISLETVRARVQDWATRGFLAAPGQTLESIWVERDALYRPVSDYVLDCDGLTEDQCLQRLLQLSPH
jgi:shikimate kinase